MAAEFRSYQAWRERYAPPIIRMRGPFIAAVDQATRYGRQIGDIDAQHAWLSGGHYTLIEHRSQIWEAWCHFVNQFNSNVREVLTRTFWSAYYA